MNLIEQLGGYRAAKWWEKHLTKAEEKGIHHTGNNSMLRFTLKGLKLNLLDYRHTNNIFEVGDKVVLKDFDVHAQEVYTVLYSGDYLHLNNGEKYALALIRHALDEEVLQKKTRVNDSRHLARVCADQVKTRFPEFSIDHIFDNVEIGDIMDVIGKWESCDER